MIPNIFISFLQPREYIHTSTLTFRVIFYVHLSVFCYAEACNFFSIAWLSATLPIFLTIFQFLYF